MEGASEEEASEIYLMGTTRKKRVPEPRIEDSLRNEREKGVLLSMERSAGRMMNQQACAREAPVSSQARLCGFLT